MSRPIRTTSPACFTIHSLKHLRAALTVCAQTGTPVVALSAPGASAYAGYTWFIAVEAHARAEFPEADLTCVLDCGERAGDAVAALGAGAKHLVFTGHPEAARRLAGIATKLGATVRPDRPQALDLMDIRDPERAIRAWIEEGGNSNQRNAFVCHE